MIRTKDFSIKFMNFLVFTFESNFYCDKVPIIAFFAAIVKIFAATNPRFSRFLPRHCRDFYDFCGTAIFGLQNRDK